MKRADLRQVLIDNSDVGFDNSVEYFHTFHVDQENNVYAIVESEQGTVSMVPAQTIVFLKD